MLLRVDALLAMLASIAICASPALGQQIPAVPAGWHLPTAKELADDWRPDNATKSAAADGDFDGDGQTDFARLLMREDKRAEGLFVWLSTRRDWLVVDRSQEVGDTSSKDEIFMGLELVPPGEERTYCKDEVPCPEGDKVAWKSDRAALDYFRPMSAGAIGHFEPTTGEFVWLWYTD